MVNPPELPPLPGPLKKFLPPIPGQKYILATVPVGARQILEVEQTLTRARIKYKTDLRKARDMAEQINTIVFFGEMLDEPSAYLVIVDGMDIEVGKRALIEKGFRDLIHERWLP